MLDSKIHSLVKHIKSQISIFGDNGHYLNPFKEDHNEIQGVTDKKDAYFFIQLKPTTTADEYQLSPKETDEQYNVFTNFQLIAGFRCINKALAIQALANALSCNPYLGIIIKSISTNSELIYKSLYKQNYYNDKQGLILINFSVSDHFEITGRCEIDFCEDCCAKDEFCWCDCFQS